MYHNTDILISGCSKGLSLRYCDIVAITTSKPYVIIHTKNNSGKILVNSTLHEIIECLPCTFFLSNQSTIVNLFNLNSYRQEGTDFLLYLDNGLKCKVARRKRKEFKSKLSYLKTILKKKCPSDCEHKTICGKICLNQYLQENFNTSRPNNILNPTE